MKKTVSTLFTAIGASLCLAAVAADTHTAGTEAGLARSDAKDLKTHSEADYKARKKVAEANEVLNKADCKSALDGSAKRACEKSAKAAARSDKADAKTVHEAEEKAIKDAKK